MLIERAHDSQSSDEPLDFENEKSPETVPVYIRAVPSCRRNRGGRSKK